MSTAALLTHPQVHDAAAMRAAGADLLSLALMDARNRTLSWLAVLEDLAWPASEETDPPWTVLGRIAWFQERWVARQLQRGRGAAARADGVRLPSVLPEADAWFGAVGDTRASRWSQPLSAELLRDYLSQTLDTTLDLLAKAPASDDGLHAFRLVLHHEDLAAEQLAALAQALDLPAERHALATQRGLWPEVPSPSRRAEMAFPARRWTLGSAPGGWVPAAEQAGPEQAVPAFEIDAQPVCWAQVAEFIQDGGYDDRGWWTEAGWSWLQAQARRAPRHVAQLNGGVLAQRQGRLQRLPGNQTALHLSAHEAEAWCRWAGRRLPTEAEWELAACTASARGWVWGDVLEWVAGRARPLVGEAPVASTASAAQASEALPQPGDRVLRGGASVFGNPRLRHPKARAYAPAGSDLGFTGFRSCAL